MEKHIAHEAPLALMDIVRQHTDYDYALVHMFEKEDSNFNNFGRRYMEFFMESMKMGREVILDNSAYELGDSFDPTKYKMWISKLKPTYYIIPDCPGNKNETIRRAECWLKDVPDDIKDLKTIGVVQGSTYGEIILSYNYWKDRCDKIAFTFYYPFYDLPHNKLHENVYVSRMRNRTKLLQKLLDDGVLDVNKKHHLLGCWLPQEFESYKNYNFIDTVDTSNPVLHGLEGQRYEEHGLLQKSDIKMEFLMMEPLSKISSHIPDIIYNINKFRSFVK